MAAEPAAVGSGQRRAAEPAAAGGLRAPVPGRCGYFVERKKRFCKMIPAQGRRFCGEHGDQEVPGRRCRCPGALPARQADLVTGEGVVGPLGFGKGWEVLLRGLFYSPHVLAWGRGWHVSPKRAPKRRAMLAGLPRGLVRTVPSPAPGADRSVPCWAWRRQSQRSRAAPPDPGCCCSQSVRAVMVAVGVSASKPAPQ